MSWDQIRNEVRSFRASVQPAVTTIRDFVFDSQRDRVYFLANDLSKSSKSPMLFRVDLPQPYSALDFDPDLDSDSDSTSNSTSTSTSDRSVHEQRLDEKDRDQDMGLVPFNPETYQCITGPSPIQILPGQRESPCSDAYPSRTRDHSASVTDQILAAAPVLPWVPVLTEAWLKHCSSVLGHSQGDRLSFYQFEPQCNRLLFPYGTVIYTGQVQEDGSVNPQPARAQYTSAGSSPNRSYSNLVHNALTAGLNLVSVSGPLTSPRASVSGSSSGSGSGSGSGSAAGNLDKAGSQGARADPKLGGSDMDLIAFTRDQDIWVMTTLGVETQLTFCSRNKKKADISCGIAEFVMQEEFHRFTNYYWAPSSCSLTTAYASEPRSKQSTTTINTTTAPPTLSTPPTLHQRTPSSDTSSPISSPDTVFSSPSPESISPPTLTGEQLPVPAAANQSRTTERILYLQVSEAMVDLVVIPRQGMHPEFEEYRYPHAGTTNAVSDLQIVEFIPRQYEEDVVSEPLHKRLWGRASLYKLFPWLEYIVRFGWLPDGDSVWVQILDRRQQVTAIVTVPLDCFMSVAEQAESTDQIEDELASRIRVIYEEQSDYWINDRSLRNSVGEEDSIQFIVSSERTGYRHLYLATHSTHSGSTVVPITAGQYQVVDKPITVDTSRQLVYFIAKRDTVLETHLYVASYATGAVPDDVKRLTELGYSHSVAMDLDKDRFLTTYSSVDKSPACAVLHLRWGGCRLATPSVSLPAATQIDNDGSESQQRSWCACGCQFPKISSHAFVIREGIPNLSAKDIRRSPVVPSTTSVSSSGHLNQHSRSYSDSATNNRSRMDSTFDGFRAGSVNSISGFLASHLLSTSLLSSSKAIHSRHQQQDSSLVLNSSAGGTVRQNPTSLKFSDSPCSSAPSSTSSSAATGSFGSASGPGSGVNASHHPVAEFFTFTSSDNVQLHGCLYRPANYAPGQKYPTLVSIYGGPRSQMVTNEYKLPKFLRVFLATRLGHAVVMIDGRGSNDRGLEFEGQLKHRMGQIELRDQVEGLEFLARPENGGLVDMERIAISGWSYGGYLSLMALAQYPHIFKIAIAGAPVSQWELYNSAYTERYMGLVHENKEGYAKSNVLNWVDKFPDSENRLLIAHGLIDENVHFKNTESLAADLVRFNKPHQIQLYPTERHGLRDARVNEHFETLMFYWLKNYL
ncbi:dipeptidylpeptidase [Mortierella sp. GBA30]|nr:dipeptidylpeptidase [Mortierella sp. GBA30]